MTNFMSKQSNFHCSNTQIFVTMASSLKLTDSSSLLLPRPPTSLVRIASERRLYAIFVIVRFFALRKDIAKS